MLIFAHWYKDPVIIILTSPRGIEAIPVNTIDCGRGGSNASYSSANKISEMVHILFFLIPNDVYPGLRIVIVRLADQKLRNLEVQAFGP